MPGSPVANPKSRPDYWVFITKIIYFLILHIPKHVWPPLWSSGQRFGFDYLPHQISWEVVGLQRDPLGLVSIIEELLFCLTEVLDSSLGVQTEFIPDFRRFLQPKGNTVPEVGHHRYDAPLSLDSVQDERCHSWSVGRVPWNKSKCSISTAVAPVSNEMPSIYKEGVDVSTFSVVQWSEFLATDPVVRVRFPALSDILRSIGSGAGPIQPREYNWGATWKKK
jgi:hypothetical protein